MRRTLAIVFSVFLPLCALAADSALLEEDGVFRPAGDTELSSFHWEKRLIVVFADTPNDPRYRQQLDMLRAEEDMLVDRDMLVLTDTDPSERTPARMQLRPREFQVVLIDKDGGIKLRKPLPRSVREITRIIDKTPLRRQEVEDRRIRN